MAQIIYLPAVGSINPRSLGYSVGTRGDRHRVVGVEEPPLDGGPFLFGEPGVVGTNAVPTERRGFEAAWADCASSAGRGRTVVIIMTYGSDGEGASDIGELIRSSFR